MWSVKSSGEGVYEAETSKGAESVERWAFFVKSTSVESDSAGTRGKEGSMDDASACQFIWSNRADVSLVPGES